MTTHSLPVPPTLSGPQRLCHQLLMLCLTADLSPAADGNMPEITPADKAEISETVCRYSSLQLIERPGGKCGLEGPTLSRRLCLVHTLHQALRLCPESVRDYFTPALRRILQAQNVPRALYDDCNLNALIALCARSLGRQFSARDAHYLRLAFQYALAQQTAPSAPEFDDPQRRWIEASEEAPTANLIFRLWQRRAIAPLHHHECLFISLLLRRLCIPDPLRDSQPHAQRLHRAILRLTNQFQSLAGVTFHNQHHLQQRLYMHLGQALERAIFNIGIENHLPEDIMRLYPRLSRTTHSAIGPLESEYQITFSQAEKALVTIIFGGWLMRETDLQEKQILLLTNNHPALEADLAQALREVTLLPLTICHQTLQDFQRNGPAPDIALIVTPWATSLPLFSAPILQIAPPLNELQQRRIRDILEQP